MAQNNSISEPICVGPRGATRYVSAFGRVVRAWISRAANLLRKHDTANPQWLKAEETYSQRTLNRYGIYAEDIGPVGLKNIQILLDRQGGRIPGSTLHIGLIGRDHGKLEKSLALEIITDDKEAVLETAAEIRRSNGQTWVGVYVTSGTFIEITGPKESIVELRDDSALDNARDSRSDQAKDVAHDLLSPVKAAKL